MSNVYVRWKRRVHCFTSFQDGLPFICAFGRQLPWLQVESCLASADEERPNRQSQRFYASKRPAQGRSYIPPTVLRRPDYGAINGCTTVRIGVALSQHLSRRQQAKGAPLSPSSLRLTHSVDKPKRNLLSEKTPKPKRQLRLFHKCQNIFAQNQLRWYTTNIGFASNADD